MKLIKILVVNIIIILGLITPTLLAQNGTIVFNENNSMAIEKTFHPLNNNDQLDQVQSEYCGWGVGILSPGKFAQTFTPSLPVLTRVKLRAWQPVMSTKGIEVSIKETLFGDVLTGISSYEITDELSLIEFDFKDILVTPGESYYIIWEQIGGSENDRVYWGYGGDDPYETGDAYYFDGSGWYEYQSDVCPNPPDFCFVTYGYPDTNPIAEFTYSPINPSQFEEITFDASDSYDLYGEIIQYQWDFGDGETDSGETVSHVYENWGSYEVTLKVIDDESKSDTISKNIQIKDGLPPTVEIICPEKNSLYIFGLKIPFFSTVIIGPIDILIDASDDESGIDYVKLYIGNDYERLWSAPYEFTWDDTVFGRIELEAIAYDQDKNEASHAIEVFKIF